MSQLRQCVTVRQSGSTFKAAPAFSMPCQCDSVGDFELSGESFIIICIKYLSSTVLCGLRDGRIEGFAFSFIEYSDSTSVKDTKQRKGVPQP